MGKSSGMESAPVGDHLSADEISAAFDVLSRDDKLKLGAIETTKRSGTSFAAGELLHEAVSLALIGKRLCPREVPFMAFLVQTMRSIAFHERKKLGRTVPLTAAPRAGATAPGGHPNPEKSLIEEQDVAAVQTIYDNFEDDPEALLVLMGWADGLRGGSLREATDLDQAALDYAAKRIRNRMRALYPQGWIT